MKRAWSLLLAATLLALFSATAAAQDVRFSQTLKPEERAAAGLDRLNTDQIAVTDALVRRDTQRATSAEERPAQFSKRLSDDERRLTGITLLHEKEVAQLDAFVDRYQGARLARTLLGPLTTLSPGPRRVTATETKPERKIHGSFSLSYGWGSGGYSEKTGSMVLNFDDPAGRYSVSVGYTESHIKGPHIYRDPYLYRDPSYDPLRAPLRPEER